MKRASFTGFAVNANYTTRHFDQTLADGQSKAGTAVFAGGGSISLGKGLKKIGGLLWGHTNAGVGHCKLHSWGFEFHGSCWP